MNLSPLLNAGPVIVLHVAAAITAFFVGIAQFVGKKGVTTHRILGWIWVIAMMVVAISSFWINEIRLVGPFSPIHLLAILTIFSVPAAVMAARRHDVRRHRKNMILIYIGALIVAGAFTLMPGRILSRVFFN